MRVGLVGEDEPVSWLAKHCLSTAFSGTGGSEGAYGADRHCNTTRFCFEGAFRLRQVSTLPELLRTS